MMILKNAYHNMTAPTVPLWVKIHGWIGVAGLIALIGGMSTG